MSQRFAILASIAIAFLFAGGVYAGRDRLMPADQTSTTVTEAVQNDIATGGQSTQLDQVALPPLSPDERAVTDRIVSPDREGERSLPAADSEDDDWDDDEHEDDDEDHDDDEDDDDRYEEHEDDDD